MLKLSVVIITFNEERNIQRCLDSVKGIADEVVVLDSFSTDRTPEICRNYGALFFQHPFDGHIQQKNRVITHANNHLVLSLDADEALDETLRNSILRAKADFRMQGYYMNRLTNYCGKWIRHSGWYPDRKLRLFDRRKGHWTGINPHDRYELHSGDVQAGYLEGNILHYSYYSVDEHYRQVTYFTDIASKAYYAKGRKAPLYKLFVNPIASFVGHFLVKRGFLDGLSGYRISRISAYSTWLKYKKLRQLYQQQERAT